MAYPSVQGPYGFLPINLIGGQVFAGSTRNMEIASGYATNIFYGDFVKRVVGGTIEKDVGIKWLFHAHSSLKSSLPGLNALFGLEYKRYGEEHKESTKQRLQNVHSKKKQNLSGFSAAPVKNEGNAIAYDNAQEAWTARYNHQTIALGFSLTEEAVEDNLYDTLSARYTKALARAMAYTKQVKAAAVLNNGFTKLLLIIGGDGVALFSQLTSNCFWWRQQQHSFNSCRLERNSTRSRCYSNRCMD
jgi:hypothetical protein